MLITTATTITALNQKPLQIRVFGVENFLRTTFEIYSPITQHKEACDGRVFAIGGRTAAHRTRFGIEVEVGQRKAVLQTVRGH